MRTVTILQKCYGLYTNRGLKVIFRHLKRLCEGLEVTVHSVEQNQRGWVRVGLSGEDEEVFLSLLEKEFGLTLNSMESLVSGRVLRGKIVDSGSVGYGLYVDLGITQPAETDALVPLRVLRIQLANGQKVSLREIVRAFCLYDNLNLEVVLTEIDQDKSIVEAHLSDFQLSAFSEWENTYLERLILVGATNSQVRNSISRSGHKRDVLRVENLGVLENSVTCKLGTHARGLITELGGLLDGVSFHVFLPRNACILHGRDMTFIESEDVIQ